MTSLPQGSTAPAIATPAPSGVAGTSGGTPSQIYRALRSQRSVLDDQLNEVQGLRRQIVNDLQTPALNAATQASLTKRLATVDNRIADLDKQIAVSDRAVAQAAAVPGAAVQPPPVRLDNPDPDMIAGLSFALLFVIAVPITIAYSRRIWRRSTVGEVRLPAEMSERMGQIERGVEAIALEVERIGEGQRFLTRAMVERGEGRAVGAGERVPVRRERAEEPT